MLLGMSEQSDQERELKVLVYGESGVGKTSLGVTAPDPLFLLAERQGYLSIRATAERLGLPCPPSVYVQSVDHLRAALHALSSERERPIEALARAAYGNVPGVQEFIATLPYQRPRTIVLDSVTEFFQLIDDGLSAAMGNKVASDGLPVKEQRHWQILGDRCQMLIRGFRDLPYHVLFLALMDDRVIETANANERRVAPLTPMRKIPGRLAAAVNAVGVMRMVDSMAKPGELPERHRAVFFSAPDAFLSKGFDGLEGKEIADFTNWVSKVNRKVSA